MTKIQLDLTDKEDYNVELFKLSNKLKNKQESIKEMILTIRPMILEEMKKGMKALDNDIKEFPDAPLSDEDLNEAMK